MRKLIAAAAALIMLIGGANAASAHTPDHTVQPGETFDQLRPGSWGYSCILTVAHGLAPDCDTLEVGQGVILDVSQDDQNRVDAWLAGLGVTPSGSDAGTAAPAPEPARSPRAESAPSSTGCAGLDGVNPTLASKVCTAINASGHACSVTSGYRSTARQAELYRAYLNGTGNLAAPPGRSNHERGQAVDVSRGCYPELAAQGLVTPVRGEPWHWELP